MLINNSHENYGTEYRAFRSQVDILIKSIEDSYNSEKVGTRKTFVFDPKKHYDSLDLLSKGMLKLRELNDFEASKLSIYKCLPLCRKYLQRITKLIEKGKNSADFKEYTQSINFYWIFVSVAARYSLNHFIEYMFHNKKKKPYADRKEILESAVFYTGRALINQLDIGIDFEDGIVPPRIVLFSTFPSSGKTLVANYSMAWIKCLAMIKIRGGGMLRIGNEENNVLINSQSIRDIIADETITDIFPEMRDLKDNQGKYYPFDKDRIDEWYLKEDKEEPRRATFKTAGSATNGIRINIMLVIDDPSRGMVDRNNVEIHKKIISSYNGDWLSRFDNEAKSFILLIGTRFNNFDVFSHVQETAERKGLVDDTIFEGVLKSQDGRIVIINIDCEDENGKSRYPLLISDETLEDKRNSMSRQEYACVYRQRPIPEDGLDFDYSILKTYDVKYKDSQLSTSSYASLDPTRKTGADFLAMPIFREIIDEKDDNCGRQAFVDCIFRRKSVKDDSTFNLIINKLIENNVRELILEVNTDTSLGQRIQDKMKTLKYDLKITEVYNTVKKSQRIADQATTIINNVIFPNSKLYPKVTDMGQFMEQLTTYSSTRANKNDDAPDSMAMYSKHKLDRTVGKNKLTLF